MLIASGFAQPCLSPLVLSPEFGFLMSASSFSAGAVPSEGAPPSTPTTCPICLDSTLDVDCAGWAGPRGCAHRGCRACVSAYWTHAIEVDGVAFPGCFFSGCPTVAATDDVVAIVGLRVTARLTYLRSRLATRTVAGEGLWCAAPRCWEPLPPLAAPPPPPPLPSPSPGSGPVADEAARLPSTGTRGRDRSPPPPQAADAARLPSPPPLVPNVVPPATAGVPPPAWPSVVCPRCAALTCGRCGAAAHDGDCAVALVHPAASAAYVAWAVGVAGACPYCGAPAVREGGCDSVSCGNCHRSYNFRPFSSTDEVRQWELAVRDANGGVGGRATADAVREDSCATVIGWVSLACFLISWGGLFGGGALSFAMTPTDGDGGGWSMNWFFVPLVIIGGISLVKGLLLLATALLMAGRLLLGSWTRWRAGTAMYGTMATGAGVDTPRRRL